MTVRSQRLANLLCWSYAASTLFAVWWWLTFRLVHHSPDIWWLNLVFLVCNVPIGASLVSVIVLAVMTHGLVHRKRLGLVAVLVFQILGALGSATGIAVTLLGTDQLDGIGPEPAGWVLGTWLVISVAGICLVGWLWPVFPARVVRGSWSAALLIVVVGVTAAVAAGGMVIAASPHPTGSTGTQLRIALLQALGVTSTGGWGAAPPPRVAVLTISTILGATLIVALAVFARTVHPHDSWTPAGEVQLRRMLNQNAETDSLAYVATRRDRLIHHDTTGQAAIAYQVIGSVALASGDPLGAPGRWDAAITAWHDHVRSFGWVPGVIACGPDGARAYARTLGFDILRLGDESVIETADFDLRSSALTEVRRAHARGRRNGLVAEIAVQSELTAEQLETTALLAASWRDGAERGFSMELGRVGDPADPRIVVATVRDQDRPVAVMTFLPWGRHGLSLDLMRRSPQAPHGVNEFLIAELMTWADDHGISRVSLNFAFLRHIFARAEDVAARSADRLGSRLLSGLDRFWQIQRLYRANAKYRPRWRPRYLAVASPLMLLPVGFAAGLAEGFLPDWFRLLRPGPEHARLGTKELAELESMRTPAPPSVAQRPLTDQQTHRRRHLAELEAAGRPGYPVGANDGIELRDLGEDVPVGTTEVIGRVRAVRDHGGVCFLDLVDGPVTRQLIAEERILGRAELRLLSRVIDSGDLLSVQVSATTSRNGTPSLQVGSWQVLAKALQPIPWKHLKDPRLRARARSLDLLVHPEHIDLLRARSRAIGSVRRTLEEAGFTEVETPILTTVHGGANARPFRTHINAYDADLALRIAPELALKRLVVSGMGAIFEIGRNFRNEGADSSHNPEFTVVEAYRPFADYHDMRLLTQRIIQDAAIAVHGRPVMPLPGPDGQVLTDISGQWPVVSVCDAVSQAVGTEVGPTSDLAELTAIAHQHGIAVGSGWGVGKVIEELYGELVEPVTITPTFYIDFPAETSPLTAPHRHVEGLVERWDLVAGGMELGTAYSELTDPIIQRTRLVEQSWQAALGDAEAMEIDEDFLSALELGMPPSGGLGIGLDRMVMTLTGSTIRQVLTFPFVRPER